MMHLQSFGIVVHPVRSAIFCYHEAEFLVTWS